MIEKRWSLYVVASLSLISWACASLVSSPPASPKTPKQPNVVIMVADDLGFADVGYLGAKTATPNIDRLSRDGVRLSSFRTSPLCSPTRAGLLTGRWPIRYGMGDSVITPWRRWGLPTTEHTLADLLGKAGYGRRGIFGKWHLGHYEKRFLPLNRGFTRFYGFYNGYVDYFNHKREGELDWHSDFAASHESGYATDLIGRAAAAFVADSRPDEPFFLYVPISAPHLPMQAKPDDLARYAHIAEADRRTYAAMVDSLDQAVGAVLAAIDARGIAEDTFVLFFSDNGGVSRYGSNLPWRGDKGSVYEGGVRVPAVVRWPAGFDGGREVQAPMGYIDVYPTVKRIAGLTGPDPNPLDGLDMLDVIRGAVPAPSRDWFTYIAQGAPEAIAVQDGAWKLVVRGGSALDATIAGGEAGRASSPSVELFRLDRDPGEKTSLVEQHPEIATRLLERLQRFRRLRMDGAPDFREGSEGFKAPKEWLISK
jgi:arylsulfatase B